jgi:hypothetical protein
MLQLHIWDPVLWTIPNDCGDGGGFLVFRHARACPGYPRL